MLQCKKIDGQRAIVCDTILPFVPNCGVRKYANTISGSFTYPAGKVPCSILVHNGTPVYAYACHGWAGKPESVIFRTTDGGTYIKRCISTSDLPSDVVWAVGGLGLLDMYNPTHEGFGRLIFEGKRYDYSDVLRRTDHTVLAILSNVCYLIYLENMSGTQVNSWCKQQGFDMAIMLDGGHIAAINSDTVINGATCQGYAIQGINLAQPNVSNIPEEIKTMKVKCTSKTRTYDVYGNRETGRYIDKNDICDMTIALEKNVTARIDYPTSSGTRTAFIKDLGNFLLG